MKTNYILCLVLGFMLTGCLPKDPPPNLNTDALYPQFHGKYKVISSISSEAIDVNLDGNVSTDMLVEMPMLDDLYEYYLELRIYGPSKYRSNSFFLFTQWWPEQFVRNESSRQFDDAQVLSYNPAYSVDYAMQGTPRQFTFSPDLKQISVNTYANENPFRWQRPESVTIVGEHIIEVVNKRTLYTRAGTKEVVITTRYERYTMTT